jgi:hypothetical protein
MSYSPVRANHCEPTKVCNRPRSRLAPGLAVDPPERQRSWGGYLILAVLLRRVILCLPWLFVRLGGAEREAGSPVPNPMGCSATQTLSPLRHEVRRTPESLVRQHEKCFYDQRAYPLVCILAGARLKAFRKLQRMIRAVKGLRSSAAVANPGSATQAATEIEAPMEFPKGWTLPGGPCCPKDPTRHATKPSESHDRSRRRVAGTTYSCREKRRWFMLTIRPPASGRWRVDACCRFYINATAEGYWLRRCSARARICGSTRTRR